MFPEKDEARYEDGELIFGEGALNTGMFRIKSGAVVLSKLAGGRILTLEVLRAGDVFGEINLLPGEPQPVSARAIGKTVLAVLDPKAMEARFLGLAQEMRDLFACLVGRLRKMTEIAAGANLLRREPRVSKAWFLCYDHPQGKADAETHDASSDGIFIKTPTPLDRGERFLLKLQLPGLDDPLEIESEVAWTRRWTENTKNFPQGMGVKFVNLPETARHALKKALWED
jgi:uncharacterized protein (TIGR02266 family)